MGLRLDLPIDFYAKNISCQTLTIPAGTVLDLHVGAAAKIDALKLYHRLRGDVRFAYATTPSTLRQVVATLKGATGTLRKLKAIVPVAVSAGTITVALKLTRSGVTTDILSSAFTIDSTTGTAYAILEPAGFTTTALLALDVLEVSVTVSGLTGGAGLKVELEWDEEPS